MENRWVASEARESDRQKERWKLWLGVAGLARFLLHGWPRGIREMDALRDNRSRELATLRACNRSAKSDRGCAFRTCHQHDANPGSRRYYHSRVSESVPTQELFGNPSCALASGRGWRFHLQGNRVLVAEPRGRGFRLSLGTHRLRRIGRKWDHKALARLEPRGLQERTRSGTYRL